MAKKSKVDLGKGFKRIYFVIAGLWIALLVFLFFQRINMCVWEKSNTSLTNIFCHDYNFVREIGGLIIYIGIVVPIYFFIKWIVAGFKK